MILQMIYYQLANPHPCCGIDASDYKQDKTTYNEKAKNWTRLYGI